MTAYRKRRDSPTLKLTRRAGFRTPHPPAVSEFRAAAFHAAVSKARELESAGASRRQSRYVLVSRRSLHAPPSTSNPLVPDVRGTPRRNHVAECAFSLTSRQAQAGRLSRAIPNRNPDQLPGHGQSLKLSA